MNTTKHTPGFWHWNEEDGTIVNFGGMVIADVRELRHESTSDVEEANARLIAAAPELLSALEALTRWASVSACDREPGSILDQNIEAARAAITKATNP